MATVSRIELPPPPAGVAWTTTSLTVLDPELPFDRLEEILIGAAALKRAMSFVIGDALLFAEARYGQRYSQAMDVTGLSYSTLANYVYVCKQVRSSRRREGLGFGHHEVVAALEPSDQIKWLDKAEEGGWSREQLRDAIQTAKTLSGDPQPAKPARTPAVRQEVLAGGDAVDAVRNLTEARETLVRVGSGLEAETAEAVGIPAAIRAVDEASETVQKAAAALDRPSLTAAARGVVRNATLSGGFYMVETEVFQALAVTVAALPEEGGTR